MAVSVNYILSICCQKGSFGFCLLLYYRQFNGTLSQSKTYSSFHRCPCFEHSLTSRYSWKWSTLVDLEVSCDPFCVERTIQAGWSPPEKCQRKLHKESRKQSFFWLWLHCLNNIPISHLNEFSITGQNLVKITKCSPTLTWLYQKICVLCCRSAWPPGDYLWYLFLVKCRISQTLVLFFTSSRNHFHFNIPLPNKVV